MDHKAMEVEMEKNLHVKRAVRRKTGNFSIPALSRVENTTVKMTIMAKGFKRDHRKPRAEFLYRSLNSLTVRFLTSSPCLNIL
jgi:hypothetical protein